MLLLLRNLVIGRRVRGEWKYAQEYCGPKRIEGARQPVLSRERVASRGKLFAHG
jgi:hypothetical protein